jgi:uncharacterized membrane protein
MNKTLIIILLVVVLLGGAGYIIFPLVVGALKALIGILAILLIGFGVYLGRRFSKK